MRDACRPDLTGRRTPDAATLRDARAGARAGAARCACAKSGQAPDAACLIVLQSGRFCGPYSATTPPRYDVMRNNRTPRPSAHLAGAGPYRHATRPITPHRLALGLKSTDNCSRCRTRASAGGSYRLPRVLIKPRAWVILWTRARGPCKPLKLLGYFGVIF
jgi:hypothetical protein